MCTCNQPNIGNSNPIADAFNRNQAAVKRVFETYGMKGAIEPTFEWAKVGATAYGPGFAREVAIAAAGIDKGQEESTYNNYNGELVDSIFSGISGLGTAAGNILTGVGALKAGQNGQPVVIYQNPNNGNQQLGNNQPVYTQQPNQPQTEQKTGGFTTGQIILLASVVLVVVGAMFWLSRNPAKA